MIKSLDVYLNNDLVGNLIQNPHGEMLFTYATTWLNNPRAIPLSHSLPLQETSFRKRECRPFFAGVLPEETTRTIMAKTLGISAKNDFSFLEKIGGECAGAVSFYPAGYKPNSNTSATKPLTNSELADILRSLSSRPLMAGETDIRLSLAGVQEKIPVTIQNDQVFLPVNNTPSTHIIKPAHPQFQGLVYNEALCMKLGTAIGLEVAPVQIGVAEDITYLIIERFDRIQQNNDYHRIHQEDFCQALGIPPENKYQNEGGPSLKQCFDLLRDISSSPVVDLQKLLDAVIFNYVIGNCDAHGKNFSLLYNPGKTKLTPLYDLVSTLFYPELTSKMAMKIGKEYAIADIGSAEFIKLSEEIQLNKKIVLDRIQEIAEKIKTRVSQLQTEQRTEQDLVTLINSRCEKIQQKGW